MLRMMLIAALAIGGVEAVAAEPGVEHWVAESTTAMGITGDITLSPTRITMAGKSLPLQVAADIPNFHASDKSVAARILRVTLPSDPVLLHGNRLCMARWIVVWRDQSFGQSHLEMAVFSGLKQPTGETDLSLCGTFMYGRP